MKRYLHIVLLGSVLSLLLIAGCSNSGSQNHNGHEMGTTTNQEKKQSSTNDENEVEIIKDNEFTIVAKESSINIDKNQMMPVWTFNGSVPGSEIRVKEGEQLTIHLKNELPEPVSIHWHGVPVPNEMDGIPGVTMNAVQPGDTFTYTFEASVPGTYWYHSHQDGVNQVDKGLYGSFIVEPKDSSNKPDRDYVLMLDEWTSMAMEQGNSSGMDHSKMSEKDTQSDGGHGGGHSSEGPEHDMSMYDILTINGRTAQSSKPFIIKEGEKVRLRLINAGFKEHKIHLHGHDFKIVSTDGQSINDPTKLRDQLVSIAPGERYDIEFIADNPGSWAIESHTEEGTGMSALIQYDGNFSETDQSDDNKELKTVDITKYGKGHINEVSEYDLTYTMDLGTDVVGNQTVFTINNEIWPKTEKIKVDEGDLVQVKLRNTSKDEDHPMHLHGHFFQVLRKNGEEIKGSPLWKDTINLKPGDEIVVAFKADNPGNWMFHCHDLHHAATGMVTEVTYKGFKSKFSPDPNAGNKPE